MKKLYFLLSTTAALLSISFSAYAGQWQQEGEHCKYLNNDGTYSAHTWQWIDGNGDGISESYYFDDNVWQRSALFSRFAVCYHFLQLGFRPHHF